MKNNMKRKKKSFSVLNFIAVVLIIFLSVRYVYVPSEIRTVFLFENSIVPVYDSALTKAASWEQKYNSLAIEHKQMNANLNEILAKNTSLQNEVTRLKNMPVVKSKTIVIVSDTTPKQTPKPIKVTTSVAQEGWYAKMRKKVHEWVDTPVGSSW